MFAKSKRRLSKFLIYLGTIGVGNFWLHRKYVRKAKKYASEFGVRDFALQSIKGEKMSLVWSKVPEYNYRLLYEEGFSDSQKLNKDVIMLHMMEEYGYIVNNVHMAGCDFLMAQATVGNPVIDDSYRWCLFNTMRSVKSKPENYLHYLDKQNKEFQLMVEDTLYIMLCDEFFLQSIENVSEVEILRGVNARGVITVKFRDSSIFKPEATCIRLSLDEGYYFCGDFSMMDYRVATKEEEVRFKRRLMFK